MSAGLFGLLDDVAALARLAAASIDDIGAAAGKATAKAAGVVIDDTAVTPQYVHGITADRDLMPDADVLGQCLLEALEELKDSASDSRPRAPRGRRKGATPARSAGKERR